MKKSYCGDYGGQFLPESTMFALNELEETFSKFSKNKEFKKELNKLLENHVGRPTPLYYARNLSEIYGHKIYLKGGDLDHTSARKISNAIAQALLAKKMGKRKIVAETGAGQRGLATAAAAALLGLECKTSMGAVDVQRRVLNVYKIELLGTKVNAIENRLKTLEEATTTATQHWVNNIKNLFYVVGNAVGPYLYPKAVTHFRSVVGKECKVRLRKFGKEADCIITAVGGGSNAAGIFNEFLDGRSVKLIGVETTGLSIDTPYHAATLARGRTDIIHGMKTKVLQDELGNMLPVHSISAGLNYPGVGLLHTHLFEGKKARYEAISDDECMRALKLLCKEKGVIPTIKSLHVLAFLEKLCPTLEKEGVIIVNLSGRGDKDMTSIRAYKKGTIYG